MRKLYLLLTMLSATAFLAAQPQDTARFSMAAGPNRYVTFTNSSIIHGDAYRKAYWSFGDGTRTVTLPLASTAHQYSAAGVYTACLRIYKYSTNSNHDSVLTAELCQALNLQDLPVPDSCRAYFYDSLPASTPFTKVFVAVPWHNHSKRPEQICWNFGDGRDTCISYNPGQPNNYAVHHAYHQAGTYQVCIHIRYQGGCESSFCRSVQVSGGDLCRADFAVETVLNAPLARRFAAIPWHWQQQRPVRICWNFGDGHDTCIQYTSTATGAYSVSHTYATHGYYNVCVRILYDGGCESSQCRTISIPAPAADTCTVRVVEAAASYSNTERHFYAVPSPNRVAERICWNFGDGHDTCYYLAQPLTSAALSITHHYPAPGVYHVCARIWYAGGCTAENCLETVIRASTNLCGGYMTDSLTAPGTYLFKGFSVMNASDHVISWHWAFSDGSSANGQQVSHTFGNSGSYEACLYIRTDLGCETRICKHLTLQGNHTLQLQLSPNPVVSVLHAVFQSSLQETVSVKIYNASGVMVRNYTRAAVTGPNNWDFDVSALPAGVYSMIVQSPAQLANALFFKQ